MAQQISYRGTSLQDSNVISSRLSHESADNRNVNYQGLARDGAKPVDDKFDVKVIKIGGIIKDTTRANLDDRIDALKKVMVQEIEGDLDIEYSTGTRRYVCTCNRFIITREHYNITLVEWEAEFIVGYPFGKDIDTTTGSFDAITTATQDSLFFYGSARPLPNIKIVINSETNLEQIQFQNLTTGNTVTITQSFSASDVLIIDTDLLKVTLNGVEIDYGGIFPQFNQGWNDFYIWFTADAYNVDLKLIYYKLWI